MKVFLSNTIFQLHYSKLISVFSLWTIQGFGEYMLLVFGMITICILIGICCFKTVNFIDAHGYVFKKLLDNFEFLFKKLSLNLFSKKESRQNLRKCNTNDFKNTLKQMEKLHQDTLLLIDHDESSEAILNLKAELKHYKRLIRRLNESLQTGTPGTCTGPGSSGPGSPGLLGYDTVRERRHRPRQGISQRLPGRGDGDHNRRRGQLHQHRPHETGSGLQHHPGGHLHHGPGGFLELPGGLRSRLFQASELSFQGFRTPACRLL